MLPTDALRRALLLAAVAAAAAPATGARAATRQPTFFDAGRAALDPATSATTLDTLDGLGVRALRVTLVWADVAPAADATERPSFDATDPAAYDWRGYGPLLDAAHARGWRVLVTFSAPVPRWATRDRRDQVTYPSAAELERFATAAGRRFGDDVGVWGLWNEPNHPRFLAPQIRGGRPVSPGLYRALHAAGVRGLSAAGQGADVLLGGETAPGGDRRRSVPPLAFVRGVLCRGCAPLRLDGWAHHPYANRRGPFYVPPDRDNVTIGVLRRLELALDRSGRRGLPVWITEFGVQSTPDRDLGVPLARQAELRSISERLAHDDPRVASFAQYLLRDDLLVSGFQSGLVRATGAPKPSFDEFRTPLVVRRRGAVAWLWGLVRPATGPTRVQVLVRDRGQAVARVAATRPTDAAGIWTARLAWRSGRTWQVRWTAPSGTSFAGPPVRSYG